MYFNNILYIKKIDIKNSLHILNRIHTMTTLNSTNTNTEKYSLAQIREINNFTFSIEPNILTMINYLTTQIGSQSSLSNTTFDKKPLPLVKTVSNDEYEQPARKKKGNRAMEITGTEDWESLRSFQTTKLEQKTGIDAQIGQIRMHLNKINDASFLNMRELIIANIDEVIKMEPDLAILTEKVGTIIYDISANNKFYSRIYADLYAELATKYDWLRPIFDANFEKFVGLFQNIVYVDPATNYDAFCDMNKMIISRKANSQFFVNLAINGFITKLSVVHILHQILITVSEMIKQDGKNDEVGELTDNVAILFNKDIMTVATSEHVIEKLTIAKYIAKLAKGKVKDYKSLPNRVIFKYMDLIEK